MSEQAPRNYLLFDFIRITAIPGLLWFRPKYLYAGESARKRIRGGAIVMANHTGIFDPVYLMLAIWYRRLHFICAREFFDGKFTSWLFRQFHCIPIDRESFSMESLRRITEELRQGHVVSIYPEGRINTGEQLSPFKSGMVLMALKSECPIVPVYIRPRRHWYSRLVVCVGDRIDVKEALGPRPSLRRMDEMAALLEEREKELAALAEGKPGDRA